MVPFLNFSKLDNDGWKSFLFLVLCLWISLLVANIYLLFSTNNKYIFATNSEIHKHNTWFSHEAWYIFVSIVTGVAPCLGVSNRMSQAVVMGKRIVGRPRIVTVGQGGVESGRGGLHCCCCTCCTCINLQFLRTVEGRLKLCEVVSCVPGGAYVNWALS
jgi:hypothetical protein